MRFRGRYNGNHVWWSLKAAQEVARLAQATRRTLLECARMILSICPCNSAAMFFLASSKLLPVTVTDKLLQIPFQPSPKESSSFCHHHWGKSLSLNNFTVIPA
jgi:hypothetical protein